MIDRECVFQRHDEVIDIVDWPVHSEYEVFPVGARDKSLRICPSNIGLNFCLPNHQYLFKESIKSAQDPSKPRHPDQYWAEVIAFRIGRLMKLDVPPVFVALNSKTGEPGSLIEWFLGYKERERFIPGGDYMQAHIPGYDREKGKLHNFRTIGTLSHVLEKKGYLTHNWQIYWGQCLCFDAVIGNTDRHQENWGLIWDEKGQQTRFSPFFDNGTSLGHELFPARFERFTCDIGMLNAYIGRGKHHMKWQIDSQDRLGLIDGVIEYCKLHPEVKDCILELLQWSDSDLQRILEYFTLFKIKHPLTVKRAEFILALTVQRKQKILDRLHNEID